MVNKEFSKPLIDYRKNIVFPQEAPVVQVIGRTMPKKLLLVFPKWCDAFGIFQMVAKKASTFPPMNLALIASIARCAGWDVRILDGEASNLSLAKVVDFTKEYQPDLVGFTATTPFFKTVQLHAHAIKKVLDIPIIVGGTHISILREQAFDENFDYVWVGECERHIQDFLNRFAHGDKDFIVPGLITRQNGQVVFGGDSEKLTNLDELPYPARDLLPQEKYVVGTLKGEKQYTTIQMSRGCPFKCVFCANDLHGRTVRRRSMENVIGEIKHVVNVLGIKHIYFLDDTLTLKRKYIFELCAAIKRERLQFTFEGGTRANLWDEEMVRLMVECGLIRISFGLESADLEIRRIIKKEVPLDAYIQANRLNNKLGIETINSVMLGLPGETRESIKRTVNFLCSSRDIHHATYGIATPYPGTELLEMAQGGNHGLILLDDDYSRYQRYGSSVMEVNGIPPKELLRLQLWGLVRIYSCWWRLWPVFKRHGIKALLSPFMAFFKFAFVDSFYAIGRKLTQISNTK